MCRRARPCSITGTRSASETSTAEPSQPGLCAVRAGAAGTHMCGARARRGAAPPTPQALKEKALVVVLVCLHQVRGDLGGARGGAIGASLCVCARVCSALSSDSKKVGGSRIGTLLLTRHSLISLYSRMT